MDSGHTCSECGKRIEGEDLKTGVLWFSQWFHFPCYKIRIKPLEDESKRLQLLIEEKKARKRSNSKVS